MNKQKPRHRSVSSEVEALIRELAASGETRVPTEDVLASDFGVSRPTIRTVLQALQRDGLIRRRHGTGTFINRYAFGRGATSITADRDILAHIKECGHTARAKSAIVKSCVADEEIATQLGVSGGDQLCEVMRLYTADGVPAVLTYEYLPTAYVRGPVEGRSALNSIIDFVAEYTDHRVAYTVTSLLPATADRQVASTLALAEGTPTLRLDSLQIASTETPVAYSRTWLNDALVRFIAVRDHWG